DLLPAQALQQLAPADAAVEAGAVVAFRDPARAALAGVEDHAGAVEATQVQRRGESRGSPTHDGHVDHADAPPSGSPPSWAGTASTRREARRVSAPGAGRGGRRVAPSAGSWRGCRRGRA